jgi:hypothetical protein
VDHDIRLNFRHSNYLQRGIVYVAHEIFESFQPIKDRCRRRHQLRRPPLAADAAAADTGNSASAVLRFDSTICHPSQRTTAAATRIIELAEAGERNPVLLCEGALKKLRGHLYSD